MNDTVDDFLKYTTDYGDCKVWTRCFNTDGYPRAYYKGNVNGKVHRIVWELYNKRSAKGYLIRHLCGNPKCINPEHLAIGTPKDNTFDSIVHGTLARAKLTVDDVKAIKVLISKNVATKEIAALFNVSSRTINSIQNNQTWKMITY